MNPSYEELLHLPHPTSPRHPRMPVENRAAQFAPFAALTGYDDAIDETARLTDQMLDLSEEAKQILDLKQSFLEELLDTSPEISVLHFVRDGRKEGGSYQTKRGRLKQIDKYQRELVFTDGTRIRISCVYNLDCDLFGGLFY
ncbi:MAG: hypothetical protein IJX28_02020 [Clostridia bacterium]|nr:hypothetical protein [Clostridia bacterium]